MVMMLAPQQTQKAHTSHQPVPCIGSPEDVTIFMLKQAMNQETLKILPNSTKLQQLHVHRKTTYESNYQNNVLQQYLHLY